MKIYLYLLIFGTYFLFACSISESIVNRNIRNCVNENISLKKGCDYYSLMLDVENELIETDFLEDKTPNSYEKLYTNVFENKYNKDSLWLLFKKRYDTCGFVLTVESNKIIKIMKSKFLKICYISNILVVIITVMLVISYSFKIETIYNLIFSNIGAAVRGVLTLLSIVLWIYCIIIWAKFDKKVSRLFFILFLSGIYVIFYFKRILKEEWL